MSRIAVILFDCGCMLLSNSVTFWGNNRRECIPVICAESAIQMFQFIEKSSECRNITIACNPGDTFPCATINYK
jgi:hypothetical protein